MFNSGLSWYEIAFWLVGTVAILILLWLFYTRQRFKAIPTEQTDLTRALRPESRYIEVDGFNLHYIQSGQGPHILLVHGIGASLYCWRYLTQYLSHNFTVTAVDLPGFGRSSKLADAAYGLDDQADRLKEFLDKVGIKKCHVIGSSMGGALSMWLAIKHPKTVQKLVCLAPAAHPRLVPVSLRPFIWTSHFFSHTINKPMITAILRRVVQDRELITPESIERYFEPYKKDPLAVRSFILATEAIADPRLPEELKQVRQPTLVLWGANDRMVNESFIDQVCHYVPRSTCYKHDFAGHHIQEDDPEWVIQKVIQFFNKKTLLKA